MTVLRAVVTVSPALFRGEKAGQGPVDQFRGHTKMLGHGNRRIDVGQLVGAVELHGNACRSSVPGAGVLARVA